MGKMYRVYRWDKTPLELGDKAEYYDVKSKREAIALRTKLNKRPAQKDKWVWAEMTSEWYKFNEKGEQ